jgi:PAS domain S-box-containing protein
MVAPSRKPVSPETAPRRPAVGLRRLWSALRRPRWAWSDGHALLLAVLVFLAALVALTAAGSALERELWPEQQELEGAARAAWGEALSQQQALFRVASLALAGFLASIVYLAGNHQRQVSLKRAVERRTRELAEREAQYRSIFESTSDGLFINNLETGRLMEMNEAAARMHGYTLAEFQQLQPAQFIHPDFVHIFEEYLDVVRQGGEFRGRAVDIRKDGSHFHVEVLGTSFDYSGQRHSLAVVRDITDQVEAQQLLERRLEERTRELGLLLDVSRTVTSTLELDSLLSLILDRLCLLFAAPWAAIHQLDQKRQQVRILSVRSRNELLPNMEPYPLLPGSFEELVMGKGQQYSIADVQDGSPDARRWQARNKQLFGGDRTAVRSWLAVPMVLREEPIGMLTFAHPEPGFFTPRHAQLAQALANHAAVAIENARLFNMEQTRAEQFRMVNEVSREISSILAVQEVANQATHLIQQAFGYFHVHIGLIKGDAVVFEPSAGVLRQARHCYRCGVLVFRPGREGAAGRVAATGEPLIVPDVTRDGDYIPMDDDQHGSALVLPLWVRGEIIGVLNMESEEVDYFQAGDIDVLQPLANQVATALENARLYEQARTLAALEERQKLARELHDSVSQAIYGIALGTRTALKLLEMDASEKEAVVPPLEYTMSLAEVALAEMRALIFELRPESLEVEGLLPALERRVEVLRARHQLEVEFAAAGEPAVPLWVKEVLFRIAQEALHNVVKHAGASRVDISLAVSDGAVALEIQDDGRGFDAGAHYPGHLGLLSMRERTEAAGGRFYLDSRPGQGTRLRAVVPVPV